MNWAKITWFPEHGVEKIHSDDIELFGSGVQGIVVPVLNEESDWIIVKLKNEHVRVDSTLLSDCPEPKYKLGDPVKTKSPRTIETGVVTSIVWHFSKNEPMYFLTINSKESDSRYYTNELEIA